MLLKRIDKWMKRSVSAVNLEFEERRCGSDRRQCADRRCEPRFGVGTDRRQGGERRKHLIEQKLLH